MQDRRTIIRTDGATRHGGRYRQQHGNRQAPHVADSQQSAARRRWAVDRPTRVAPRNRNRRAQSAIGAASHGHDFIRRGPARFAPFPRRSLRDRGGPCAPCGPGGPCVFSPAASMTRTSSPSPIESGGLATTRSSWRRPPVISTSVPRSRAILHFLEGDTVVKPDRCDFHRVLAKQQSAGREPQRIRVGRDFKTDSGERARGKSAVLIVGDQFDQQRARFLVNSVRGRQNCRIELAIGVLGQFERRLHAVS